MNGEYPVMLETVYEETIEAYASSFDDFLKKQIVQNIKKPYLD